MTLDETEPLPALLVYPMKEEAARFYRRFGFEPSPLRGNQLLLLLKDARRVVAEWAAGLIE